ncbi:DUF3992 domain-containing protein [Oceanobacillus profundus]|uniref:DUF3992 domain-containing protein n=1 Tax=Oceanobacillus profundus TaxID=372463 RepID=UPI003632635E
MVNNTTQQQHCINVLKVYDWISKQTDINLCKSLACKELVTDKICGNINLPCEENTLIWKANGKLSVSGDVTVFHEMGCQHIKVIVNKKNEYILSQGEERTISFKNLKSLEVRCNGNANGICFGKYYLTIHYKVNKTCFSPGDCQLKCFFI